MLWRLVRGRYKMTDRLIINEIDYFGSTITVRSVTDDSYSDWGDADESASDTTSVKAFVQILNQSDDLVKDGTFQAGDKLFWLKPAESNISRGNRIIHDSNEYEIVEIVTHEIGDTNYVTEARTKKV